MKKNVGTRTKPTVYSPEEQRARRAKQAARAILAGRKYDENWDRIERHLRDLPAKRYDFMGLEIPGGAITRCWPDKPAEPATVAA